jgi:hypothetical protein
LGTGGRKITALWQRNIFILPGFLVKDDGAAGAADLCDGYWRREYFKPEAERDWDHVARKLDGIDQTARDIKFALLEAAEIRTRIMLAE